MTKIALITGGSQGIGKSIAKTLSEDGFAISIVARDKEKIKRSVDYINNHNSDAAGFVADVTKPEDVNRAVENTVERFGGLSVFVNNAGVSYIKPLLRISPKEMKKVLDVNVMGTFYGIQAAANQFIAQNTPGKIINAGSFCGQTGTVNLAADSTSKFAVRGLTQVAAKELAKYHITVNAYCPGIIMTPMAEKDDFMMDRTNHVNKGVELHRAVDQSALKRAGKPQDVANLVSFLASHKSDYVTGQSYVVDGGITYH
ncbi:SDR family oxidoreductase [uncultured bacterium]|nr:SDR family oxidoreductase [uncultured bacterium]